ncbi:MAG: hypothetical protein F4Y53_00430 [Proteobacteria bacterium]|nr:hypothetical protein [Pseudomonadota bacterium]
MYGTATGPPLTIPRSCKPLILNGGRAECEQTLINSQETRFVTGLAIAKQLGADYPFQDTGVQKWFNFYGCMRYGWRFKKA